MAAPAPASQLVMEGYNVDALSAVPGASSLVAGLSSFIGQEWTGAVAVLGPAADGSLHAQALLPVRAGVPAVACLPHPDEFTGRRVLASGSDEGSVDLWYLSPSNAGTRAAAELSHATARVAHDAAVLCLTCPTAGSAGSGSAQQQQQLASASADGTLRLWDCSQLLACTAQLGIAGGAAMNGVAWTADPSLLASASADGRLCLWDARQLGSSPAAAAAVGAPALAVAAAAGGSGSQLLVAGDLLGRLSVFDARNLAQPLQQRRLHGDAVHALAASASGGGGSGSQVASGGDDGAIMLLDLASLAASRQLLPARREGEVPLYVRSLAWAGGQQGGQKQQLYRGGWDQAVAQVPL
ncbi:hypothetical protein ABPG75_008631 [Micractinium tetrahymenae]